MSRAAISILENNDKNLQWQVLSGHVPLLAAAHQVKPVVRILKIYSAMDTEAKNKFFRTYGADQVLNDLVAAETRPPMSTESFIMS
jgi:hypothetical protein